MGGRTWHDVLIDLWDDTSLALPLPGGWIGYLASEHYRHRKGLRCRCGLPPLRYALAVLWDIFEMLLINLPLIGHLYTYALCTHALRHDAKWRQSAGNP